ncbi:MAG: 30S ribosomal protein S16 [Saprospiraceae bacterium]|nr:30S ribosomal protein S16 [Saprospiraceae bacterium]
MSVKIRLARRGRRKKPYYHIVVADARAPRDGRFIENLGSYNPMTTPATIQLDIDRAYEWLQNGAQPTHTARAILRFKGVMYKKHLQRGVSKGALSQEEADQLLRDWISVKEAKVADRVEASRKEKEDFRKMISGEIKVVKKATADDDAKEAFRETKEDSSAAEAVAEATEAVTEEPAAVVEETVEAVAETTEEAVEAAVEASEEVAEAVEEKVEEVAEVAEEKVEEVAETVAETTEEVVEEAKEIVSEEAPSTEEE